jgi:hypothetical protein
LAMGTSPHTSIGCADDTEEQASGPTRPAIFRRPRLKTRDLKFAAASAAAFGVAIGAGVVDVPAAQAHSNEIYCNHYVKNTTDTCYGYSAGMYSNSGFTSQNYYVCVDAWLSGQGYNSQYCQANHAESYGLNGHFGFGRTWLNATHNFSLFHEGIEYY